MVDLDSPNLLITDPAGRFAPFHAEIKIATFHEITPNRSSFMPYYRSMQELTNVNLAQEMAVVASSPEAREFCRDNSDINSTGFARSDVTPSIGVMYGEKGVVLVYQPVFDPATKTTAGMVYENGVWRPDGSFDKDSTTPGLHIGKDGKQLRVYTSHDGFEFPAAENNEKWCMPFTDKTRTLLDVFPPENHGFPMKFTSDREEAEKAYLDSGIAASIGEVYPQWMFIFYRLSDGNHRLRRVRRYFHGDSSWLDVSDVPGSIGYCAGVRFVSE